MHDQRLVNRLQNYWELIRRGKVMPEINQFNTGPIDDLWSQCMKFEVTPAQGGGHIYTYRFLGEKLIPVFGRDLTGTMVNKSSQHYPFQVIIQQLEKILNQKTLIVDENQFINPKGKVVKYRACFMPFGNENRGVTHIIVGLSDKHF
jgi:hypothetical protein